MFDDDPYDIDENEDAGAQDDASVHAALAILRSDASEEDRAQAAIALGPALELADLEEFDFGLTESVAIEAKEALWTTYNNPAEPLLVRRRALESLVRWPEDQLVPAVRTALDTPGDWRLTGLFCAGALPGPFEADIRTAVTSPVLAERLEAWVAAGQLQLDDLWKQAVEVASSEAHETDERVGAIIALQSIGADEPSVGEALLKLQDHPNKEIGAMASAAFDERELLDAVSELLGLELSEGDDDPD